MTHFLGIDLGSSSVKATILDGDTGRVVRFAAAPEKEMNIDSPAPHWAEQDPAVWWENTVHAVRAAIGHRTDIANSIAAIGISYQMHGLVLVDKDQRVLRPSIIWCDSRAVETGSDAYAQLGAAYCMERLLNSPGNFTASKLKWVKDHEPNIYQRIHKAMLPGDYLAMRLTGEIATTVSGLSEGIFWDYQEQGISSPLMAHYGLDPAHLATIVPTFSVQGKLTSDAADALGMKAGTPISYRAGDQPNNAFSLNALEPGEMAATAGTSGVIYAVTDSPVADKLARVNTFVHVNHDSGQQRYGVLMCVNGTGSMNSWLRKTLSSFSTSSLTYEALNAMAAEVPVGSEGLAVLPFGNGAERILANRELGASVHGLDLNRHNATHLCRATQEGIAFAMAYGFEILQGLGIRSSVIRAGNANMFLSPVFCETFAAATGTRLELLNTDGSQGAARGAGVGVGFYRSPGMALLHLAQLKAYEPGSRNTEVRDAFVAWKAILGKQGV